MISIIICSRKPDISAELRNNIDTTIGCDHEIVVIDNSQNKYSIFSAYNEGVRRAKGAMLCFMHEDIIFRSSDWGAKIRGYFTCHQDIGMIGFLGGHYLPKRPCSWPEPRIESTYYIQGETINGIYSSRLIDHHKYRKDPTIVAAIDGAFMAIPKYLFDENKVHWDDKTYSGFHYYDMDMSMQITSIGMCIGILWNVLIEHKSCGSFDKSFLKARQLWYLKWKNQLPVIRGVSLSEEDIDISKTIIDITDQSYAYNQVILSKAYRLGKAILHPCKSTILKLFNN